MVNLSAATNTTTKYWNQGETIIFINPSDDCWFTAWHTKQIAKIQAILSRNGSNKVTQRDVSNLMLSLGEKKAHHLFSLWAETNSTAEEKLGDQCTTSEVNLSIWTSSTIVLLSSASNSLVFFSVFAAYLRSSSLLKIHTYVEVWDDCCYCYCFDSAGVRSSLHGDQRQVRSQCRAGFHCCG